jgi:predicted nucleotidyltransferase
MISQETIQEVVRRLIKAYNPLEIYLFGAYAWGHPDNDSDLDVLVIIESSNETVHKRGDKAFDTLLSLEIPKTVIILTKQEFDSRLQDKTSFCYEVKSRGKQVYARV